MKKALILLLIVITQISIAQTKELKWSQVDVIRFGDQITYKLKHNYDVSNPDKPNELLNGTYKIGEDYGSYAIINFKAGKVEGEWKSYNSSGNIESIGNYIHSKPEGKYTEYFNDGKIQKVTYYKNGKQHGKSITYDHDGEKTIILNYVNGKQEGKQEGPSHIYGFKKCRYVHHLKNGKPKGLWETKCRGKVVSSRYYVNDKEYTEKVYFKNGQLKQITSKKDGLPNGDQKEYDIDGILLKHYVYEEGILTTKKKFFETGKLKMIEHRNLDDEKHGIFIVYRDTGKKVIEGNYKNGHKNGIWKEYFENGEISNTTTFKNGKKTGITIDYYKGNVKELVGEYFKNKKVGIWKRYSIIGKLLKEFTYENGRLVAEKKIID